MDTRAHPALRKRPRLGQPQSGPVVEIEDYRERTWATLAYLKTLPPWPEPLPWENREDRPRRPTARVAHAGTARADPEQPDQPRSSAALPSAEADLLDIHLDCGVPGRMGTRWQADFRRLLSRNVFVQGAATIGGFLGVAAVQGVAAEHGIIVWESLVTNKDAIMAMAAGWGEQGTIWAADLIGRANALLSARRR